MTSTESPYPDIEVYIKGVTPDVLKQWIEAQSEQPVVWTRKAKAWIGQTHLGGHRIPVHVIEDAVDGYHCVWWESPNTPWKTDLEFGRVLFTALGGTLRCSLGSWSGQHDDAGWMEISDQGEHPVKWDNPA